MNTLFLDDDENRCQLFLKHRPTAYVVHTAQECMVALKAFKWDQVFLDHDLGGPVGFEESNGYNSGTTVVDWIAENKPIVG